MKYRFIFVLVAALFYGGFSFAQGTDKSAMEEPSKETRTQMAQLHEQMAICLRSDKPFSECHKGMMVNCPMAKDGNCPMMGSKMPMMRRGMMKGRTSGSGQGQDTQEPAKQKK